MGHLAGTIVNIGNRMLKCQEPLLRGVHPIGRLIQEGHFNGEVLARERGFKEARRVTPKLKMQMKNKWIRLLLFAGMGGALLTTPLAATPGTNFPVVIYTIDDPPPTPSVADLPLMTQICQAGITWTFSLPVPVGRFVNGDYYVVGPATIIDVDPPATNGYNGSMLNIQVNIQHSGFDWRIQQDRYNPDLRVYPPIILTPGNELVSSISAETNLQSVMRPDDTSVSPVASVSILTSMAAPQPPDAFRPSYAQGATNIYLSRNLQRQQLPTLAPVQYIPTLAEFEGYLRQPWVDSVFFSWDAQAQYMTSYGREGGYLMSFAGLLLTLDFTQAQKEPLLVYLVQYGIDLYGLVQQGHDGWPAWGGHGTGRKFPIVLAGVMLNQTNMSSVVSQFGEDMQTIWVNETPPAGTYTQSWQTEPQTAVYGGHVGINGNTVNPGWGPYEHLQPTNWANPLGEEYRRCCTSCAFIGEALAARLIPGMQTAWNHPQFFAYCDRWMFVPDDPRDVATMLSATGFDVLPDYPQGQSWYVLGGGGYVQPYSDFVDLMWAAYRNAPQIFTASQLDGSSFSLIVTNLNPDKTNYLQLNTNLSTGAWTTIYTNVTGAWGVFSTNAMGANLTVTNVTGTNAFMFQDLNATNTQRFYRLLQLP
jgi:hypothetical protein